GAAMQEAEGFQPDAAPIIDRDWGTLPAAPSVRFKGEAFPAYAMRPNQPVKPHILRAIAKSERSIHIALYSLSLEGVVDALKEAKGRGVEIHVLLDYNHVFPKSRDGSEGKRNPELTAILEAGFEIGVVRGFGKTG